MTTRRDLAIGEITECLRCGKPLVCAPSSDGQPIHRIEKEGWCPECATTAWLKDFECSGMMGALISGYGPSCMLAPHIREGFASLFTIGKAPIPAEEVDWEQLVRNWDLPD